MSVWVNLSESVSVTGCESGYVSSLIAYVFHLYLY